MARIRTIKPQFWDDEKIALLPVACRLFFIGCWNYADDMGVVEANPVLLKNRIFPFDSFTVKEISSWIEKLTRGGQLVPIEYKGAKYLVIRNWTKHQVINRPNKKQFHLPDDVRKQALNVLECGFTESSLNNHGAITDYSLQEKEGNGKGIGKGIGGDCKGTLTLPYTSDSFVNTWNTLVVQKNWRGKSVHALQLALNHLGKFDEAFSVLLMERAIENGWKGVVYDGTPESYEKWKRNGQPSYSDGVRPCTPLDL